MVGSSELIAGGPQESIFQPEWAPDGTLYFVSDRTGWWNLYRRSGGGDEAVAPMEAEFGLPQWVFGMATYAFLDPGTILATYTRDGTWHLATIAADSGDVAPIDSPFTEISRAIRGERLSGDDRGESGPADCGRALRRGQRDIRDTQALVGCRGGSRLSVDARTNRVPHRRTVSPRTAFSISRRIRTSSRPAASCRRSWCRVTAVPPTQHRLRSACPSSSGRPAGSPCSTSTTVAAPAMAAHIVSA